MRDENVNNSTTEVFTNQLPIEVIFLLARVTLRLISRLMSLFVLMAVPRYINIDNIEIIAVSRDLRHHTRHEPTRRQHIFRLALIYRQTHIRILSFDSTKRSGNISHLAPNELNVVGVRNKRTYDLFIHNKIKNTKQKPYIKEKKIENR